MTRADPSPRRRPGCTALALVPLLASLAAGVAAAEGPPPYEVGERVGTLVLTDQFGEEHSLDDSVRLVLFGRDMDGGNLLKDALADEGPDLLAETDAIYVADIHRMPSLIARLFALPSLRDRPYPIWIDREGGVTARIPSEPGKATVLRLDQRRITSIEFASTVDEVQAAVRQVPVD